MNNTKSMTITIPACTEHDGWAKITAQLPWVCPACGGPRGEIGTGFSYDGSRRLPVSTWQNPCGHVDSYDAVRNEIYIRAL